MNTPNGKPTGTEAQEISGALALLRDLLPIGLEAKRREALDTPAAPSTPLPCGARTRSGPCAKPKWIDPVTAVEGKRCAQHGGRSTGPRTPEGREKCRKAAYAQRTEVLKARLAEAEKRAKQLAAERFAAAKADALRAIDPSGRDTAPQANAAPSVMAQGQPAPPRASERPWWTPNTPPEFLPWCRCGHTAGMHHEFRAGGAGCVVAMSLCGVVGPCPCSSYQPRGTA